MAWRVPWPYNIISLEPVVICIHKAKLTQPSIAILILADYTLSSASVDGSQVSHIVS